MVLYVSGNSIGLQICEWYERRRTTRIWTTTKKSNVSGEEGRLDRKHFLLLQFRLGQG